MLIRNEMGRTTMHGHPANDEAEECNVAVPYMEAFRPETRRGRKKLQQVGFLRLPGENKRRSGSMGLRRY